MKQLLVVCGPTATGKSGLALELAKMFKGELISCDSRQVYKYLDVVTGKDLPTKYKVQNLEFKVKGFVINYFSDGEMRIWGYDLVRPDQEFNVGLYLKFVKLVLVDIRERGKLPILVGGTGFYVKSLLDVPETVGVPVDRNLREWLKEQKAEKLLEILKDLDPSKAEHVNESDRQNPRRLVRAIEVAKEKSKIKNQKLKMTELKEFRGLIKEVDSLMVGLTLERKRLYGRIDERVERRLVDKRLADELEYLLKKDYLKYVPAVTIGYQQLIEWMGGLISFEEMVRRWKFAEHGYARRQLTWFKKMKEIKWFDVSGEGWKEKIKKLVEVWLK